MPPEAPDPPPLWSTQQLADYLGVTVTTLHAMRRRGEGPTAYRVGRVLKYDPTQVAAWLQTTAVTGTPSRQEKDDG